MKKLLIPVVLPVLLIVVLLGLFTLLLALAQPAYDLSVEFQTDVLGIIIQLIGTIMIGFVAMRFIIIYKRKPSRTRMLVLISIMLFFASFLADFLVGLVVNVDQVLRNFSIDFAMLLISVTLYYLAFFGIEVLITPDMKEKSIKLELVLLVMYVISITSYITEMVRMVPLHRDIDGIFRDVALISAYLLAFICLVILFLMSIVSFKLSRKTESPVQREGLVSLGIAFLLIISSLIIIVIIPIIDEIEKIDEVVESLARVTAIGLLLVGIYFSYNGFIKPASLTNNIHD